ncbi:MAG: amino acid adenylation domain-containing protein, partial [Verrucomicrobia bacterium]|nr:amino acid adenylation domain-containing protein [Verrucomicrobiota bacterium]
MNGQMPAPVPVASADKRARLARLLAEKAGEATTTWPLSAGQEALWFLHQTDPTSAAYHTAFALWLRGPLDAGALIRALRRLVARHAALRLRFTVENGAPAQLVPGHLMFEIGQVEADGWTDGELAERVAADYARPFDLAAGPPARATLFARRADEHVLLCTIHHVAGDAWTNWVLLDELRQFYGGERTGRSVELPRLEASYGDFVRWQRAALAGEEGERWWEYWRGQLAGELPALALPADFPRPAVLVPRGDAVPLDLPPGLMAGVSSLARSQGATPFAVLLAAFHAFLNRHSGQDDIIVGTPTVGRSRPEFAGLAGYFVNPVPMRARLSGRFPFVALLAAVRQGALSALAHADLPLPVLVDRLRLPRDPARSPLFQTLFVYQKPPPAASGGAARAEWGGLNVGEFPLVQMAGQFELMLEIFEGAGASLKYQTSLFSAETARRMARRFRVLLEGIVIDPSRRLDELPVVDETERALVVTGWNRTPADYPQEQCLHELIAAQTARTPDAVAVTFEGAALTYRELDARANQLAHWLRRAGTGPETLVGVCAERSLDLVIALLGVLKAGSAYVPLDPSYPRERLAFIREDSAVPVVLTQRKFAGDWSGNGARVLRLDADWTEVACGPTTPPATGVAPDHPAYMIYTSGSTGRPKGAVNTHRAIVNRLLWMQDAYQLTPADRVVQKTPFSFDVSVWEFFWPLLAGARLVVARPGGHQDAAYLADLFAREAVTTAHFVPSMLQLFVEEPGLARCQSLRQVVCSGEALPADLAERFLARHPAALHNLYGPTEAAVDVTYWQCARGEAERPVPIGHPIARTQMYVLDGRFQPTPVGVAGELHIGGIALARGYHRRPD